jgi:hypothetical protein
MNKFLLLFVILYSPTMFCQTSDSVQRQIEISGVGYKFNRTLYMQFAMGINVTAKRENWFNNIAFSVNIQDARRDGMVYTLYSLSVGKSYQHIHNKLFWSAGLNTGPYYAYVNRNDGYMLTYYGVSLIPKLEIGYAAKKNVLAVGWYFSAGAGSFQKLYNGVEQPNYLKIIGFTNLYLKLILK